MNESASRPPLVVLTTDFGEGSRYVAAMKGVIYSINPAATVVDATHAVPPQDIAAGSRVLAEVARWFPPHAVHVAVIDPGVGSEREIVYCEFGDAQNDGARIVCPDNGLLTNLADRAKPRKMRAVENRDYWLPEVSPTFHGRDIMAPVAAHLSLGLSPDALGRPLSEPVMLDANRAISKKDGQLGQRIEGEVIEVDPFGNLITNITEEQLADCPRDESVTIRCDEHETIGVYRTYSDQPPMTLLALVGSSGALELAIVDDSAKIMLGVGVGVPVVVCW